MSACFVDTSAIAKYFVPEIGTRWLRQLLRPASGNVVIVSYLTTVEMVSLLVRKQRSGQVSPTAVTGSRDNFLKQVETRYLVTEVNHAILDQARYLVSKHSLRTLDAIQLASALDVLAMLEDPIIFLSGDQDLLAAAQAEGFSIDDPNLHP